MFSLLWWGTDAIAQRSKDGTKTVSTANNVVNEYTTLTANAVSGASTITVASSTLNTNGRFPGNLAPGDLIMIIQVQGATIVGTPPTQWDPWSEPRDSTWGAITNYNTCGNWEFAEVTSVPSGTSITLDCPIINNYTSSGKVVIVRVPRYSSLTINNGGTITCDPWNGSIGGICAIEVQNATIINTGGSVDVSGKGFRSELLSDSTAFGVGESASLLSKYGAEKGEGIAGFASDYDAFGGRYCRGAPANGGGGGDSQNGGGGGGANGGNPLSWNGHGIPDNTGPSWNLAWNLQYPGFSTQTSTGGGQGGYTFSSANLNPTVVGPSNASWSGDSRNKMGGFGGRPLDYSTGRLFLGGGGGSGNQNNNVGGVGGSGGGLIYLMNYGTVSGAGQFISNGNGGANTHGVPIVNSFTGDDGAGGAGAGGTIIINSVGNISGVSATANGGKGGDQLIIKGTLCPAVYQAFGPGGGGGGGYIGISNGNPLRTATGGANGICTSDAMVKFLPNGATKGDSGTTHGVVANFIINAPNITICAGQAATLNATLSGTVPAGTSIIWYNNIVAGTVLGTGNTYTTTVLAAGTYTYYVGTCPGTYHQPVIVTATSSPVVSASPNSTICTSGSTTLSASGGTAYVWSPATGLSNPNISNPIASPASTTTYIVTVTTPCGPGTATVVVTVNSSLSATVSPNTTICSGGQTTLTASGGANYLWTTGATTTSITVAPTATTNYSVTVSNGNCSSTSSVTVTVASGLTASINAPSAICTGNSATLTASGGANYLWNTSATTSSIIVTPTSNTTYSVTVSNGNCSSTASVTVNVSASLTATVSPNTTICSGSQTTLTASGGANYSWSNGSTTATIVVTPTASTSYSVVVSSGNCSSSASVAVVVNPGVTAFISGTTTICGGGSTTLTASGGGNYLWTTGSTSASVIVSPTSTTNYSVTVSNGNCSSTASVTVTISNGITASISGNTILCPGNTATLTASGGGTYVWSTGQSTAVINTSTAGNYSVLVTVGSCTAVATTNITASANPTVTISPNILIVQGQSANLTASGGTNYVWNNGMNGNNITVSPISTTVYCVTVYDSNNCHDSACVTVTVEICSGALYLPNAFSPNGDGSNDSLQIYYGFPQCIKDFRLVIYNRWGEKIYETTDPAFRWGGVYNKSASQGTSEPNTEVFTYYMDATILGESRISRKGNISLVR